MIIRSKKANMMIMTILVIGLLIIALIIGLGFSLLFYDQKRGQSQCDEIALNMAEALNSDNRIGQMNTIVEHSRQLVYLDRQQLIVANNDPTLKAYVPLAAQFSLGSTEGAVRVNTERINQINIAIANCSDYAKSLMRGDSKGGSWLLPWFVANRLTIKQIEFGSINSTLSSSESSLVIPNLHAWDTSEKFVEKGSNLYYGNINAVLPAPDSQLPFFFSALPAQVGGTNSPARLVNAGAFVSSAVIFDSNTNAMQQPLQLPGAVQVSGTMHIQNGKDGNQLDIQVGSKASAPGALERL
jgi:hypothetical protein